ncbi:hypothetical protein [Candidatus Protochlamydia phocaeensis]|uniref:hypothetical protein n=1 Tax=Candidatus Protochlamydia phocaeensis TaxID=1414722 RepID=UPI00083805EA|nr:hypothetical protein [Candidatus Protochlamydia phocaeensis]
MFNEALSRWNPFNVFGSEIEIEDIIRHPLQHNETLMQDSRGRFHRITAPASQASFWDKLIFWIQTHLNQKGHLDAIDNIILSFQERVLQQPILAAEELKAIKAKMESLKSLKNDYCFTHLHLGDPLSIDLRLKAIEDQAYSIFEKSIQQMAKEQEDVRRKQFVIFTQAMQIALARLNKEYLISLKQLRFLVVSFPPQLTILFQDRIENIRSRLFLIQQLNDQIVIMKKDHQGKFTISGVDAYLEQIRSQLRLEIEKIKVEIDVLIENLKINHHINPLKEQIAEFLVSIGIHLDEEKEIKEKKLPSPIQCLLEEIEQIKRALI